MIGTGISVAVRPLLIPRLIGANLCAPTYNFVRALISIIAAFFRRPKVTR